MDTEIIRILTPHLTRVILPYSNCCLAALSPVHRAGNMASPSQFEEIHFDTLAKGMRGNHQCVLLSLHLGLGRVSRQEAAILRAAKKVARYSVFWDSQRIFLRAAFHCWWTVSLFVSFDLTILSLFSRKKKTPPWIKIQKNEESNEARWSLLALSGAFSTVEVNAVGLPRYTLTK